MKVGKIYDGKVTSIKDFGAFIEIVPGRDGLCHISELDDKYVDRVDDVVKVGDKCRSRSSPSTTRTASSCRARCCFVRPPAYRRKSRANHAAIGEEIAEATAAAIVAHAATAAAIAGIAINNIALLSLRAA